MLTLQILLALLALTAGPVLLWRRRDNVFGYIAAGFFVATYLIPLAPTLATRRLDRPTLVLYADILALGAAATLAGLWLGGQIGARSANRAPFTFGGHGPIEGERAALVAGRARRLAVIGILALAAAFALMHYVPYFAADRTAAKYGVGPYRVSFLRGAVLYRFGLAMAAAILPVLLAVWWRWRRPLDLLLAAAAVAGLLLSLSRESAFLGPLVFVVGVAVERRMRPAFITGVVVVAFSLGALLSLALLQNGDQPTAVAGRIASSAPDVRDHLGFLEGFGKRGEPTYGRTILAGLSLSPGPWDPSSYALHTLTGFRDFSDFASGGLRLPAPIWGYASFGWAGVAMFSALSGVFAGWGLVKVRRLLGPALGVPGFALNLAVAYVFYEGTFAVLSEFYFLTSSVVVRAGVAVALGLAVRIALVRAPGAPGPRRPARLAAAHG